jgi:Nucleotidyl transferase AbiEii toxin, Type IV TA system
MSDHLFSGLPDRNKPPTSRRHLDQWVQQAQPKTGIAAGRLGWLVASSVVIAALQQARSGDGHPRFLLKGGAYLEVRLGLRARATKDIDTMFRGDFSEFASVLDEALSESWGAIELVRTELEPIVGARRVVKPFRFKVKLLVNGQPWRTIDVEAASATHS